VSVYLKGKSFYDCPIYSKETKFSPFFVFPPFKCASLLSGSALGRNESSGYSFRGSMVSRPQSERSDSGVGMNTPRSASSPRGAMDEAGGGGNLIS
jgi:hypothetical protein